LQDAVDYFPLEARTYIVPVVQLASQTAPWLFVAGMLLQLPTLTWVGVILFGSSSLFALITLPVEFNAGARAQELLISQGIIRGDEQIAGVQKVLGGCGLDLCGGSCIRNRQLAILRLRPAFPGALRR
jgi:Zn-dependent membrane protease YugP